MRTRSPLADREPCLCSPPEEKPHCVFESERTSMCVCLRARVCFLPLSLSDWDIGSLGEVGKPRGTREGLLSPAAQGEGTTYWCLPLKHTRERGSFSCFAEHGSCIARLFCCEWLPFASKQSPKGGWILCCIITNLGSANNYNTTQRNNSKVLFLLHKTHSCRFLWSAKVGQSLKIGGFNQRSGLFTSLLILN